jgi:hypothetical protein
MNDSQQKGAHNNSLNKNTFDYPLSKYSSLPHNNTSGLETISKLAIGTCQGDHKAEFGNLELSPTGPSNGDFTDKRFTTLEAISVKGLTRD